MIRVKKSTFSAGRVRLLLAVMLASFGALLIPYTLMLLDALAPALTSGSRPSASTLPTVPVAILAFIEAITVLQLMLAIWLGRSASEAIKRVEQAAMLDSLSGLPNRRGLRAEMASRMKRGRKAAIAFIDLDAFKAVNDTFGHDIGDSLIAYCAQLISSCCDGSMTVARLGGDEFAIFVTGSSCGDRVAKAAHQLINSLSDSIDIEGRRLKVGASVGLASNIDNPTSASELMRRADLAMYAAKKAGKMRAIWFEPALNEAVAKTSMLTKALRKAIERDEIEIDYQPQLYARTENIVGVEALARWPNGPDGKDVSPSIFIPIAEDAGLIENLGLMVLRKACQDVLHWPTLRLSVNVSTAQLRNRSFPQQVMGVLNETGFPANRLEFEVTESLLVQDPELAKAIMVELRELGIHFSLDDFGTGFASIGFLRQFHFETLKLDRSLVMEAETSEAGRALINASISLADALGMSVTAEGIETRFQADLMRIAGCRYFQGWHFARPMSAALLWSKYAGKNDVRAA